MKRLIIFLLALVFTFSACGTLHTAQWEPRPTPPVVSTVPRTPEEQLLYDLSNTTQEAANHTLCGTAEYKGRKFAMIATEGVGNYLRLAEYAETDEGYVLLAVSEGWAFSAPGYIPIVAQFEDLTVCWSYITSQRLVPDNDGNAENDVYIPNDYTAIRITLADGTVRDEPIACDLQTSNLFFCVLDAENLPTGFVPLSGDTEVTEWATGTGEPVDPIPAICFSTNT